MWKDYLHFTRSEQRAILLLISLIFLSLLLYALMPRLVHIEAHDYTDLIAQIDSFYLELEKDSIQKAERFKKLPPELFCVDTVSEAWLARHGMPAYLARNLVSYRGKGGQISSPEKFRGIYGMNDSVFAAWKQYVVYSSQKTIKPETEKPFVKTPVTFKTEPEFQVDINTADTALFQAIRGIGPSFAARIVKYRKALGGYHCLEQIREVYGMDEERYQSIRSYLIISPVELRRLCINKVSVSQMKYHPYFNFYQAKAVYEYRLAGNTIPSWEAFLAIAGLDTAGMKYLEPYLDFTPLPSNEKGKK